MHKMYNYYYYYELQPPPALKTPNSARECGRTDRLMRDRSSNLCFSLSFCPPTMIDSLVQPEKTVLNSSPLNLVQEEPTVLGRTHTLSNHLSRVESNHCEESALENHVRAMHTRLFGAYFRVWARENAVNPRRLRCHYFFVVHYWDCSAIDSCGNDGESTQSSSEVQYVSPSLSERHLAGAKSKCACVQISGAEWVPVHSFVWLL